MAWVRASTPTAAVKCGGVPSVRQASITARSGIMSGWMMRCLTCSPPSVSVTTVALVASEPVPAVVGTAISGARRTAMRAGSSAIARTLRPGLAASTTAALAASRMEPPPKAMTPSKRASRIAAAMASTSAVSGSRGA